MKTSIEYAEECKIGERAGLVVKYPSGDLIVRGIPLELLEDDKKHEESMNFWKILRSNPRLNISKI